MPTIWKFSISITGEQTVSMPGGAKILSIGVQHGTVSIWAHVEPGAAQQIRTIRIYGTGHTTPTNPGIFIGTFMMYDGDLVFHAFEGL